MQHLGHTRSAYRADHLLHTPDTFIRAPLPGMTGGTAVVHIGPAAGARFTAYSAILEPGGTLGNTADQRFVYVLDGELLSGNTLLKQGEYLYTPAGADDMVKGVNETRVFAIEKPYVQGAQTTRPERFTGREASLVPEALGGDEGLQVRTLVPRDTAYDFAVNTMTFDPGASLALVEIHVMEHGLLMLSGGGIYRLGESWYPVREGDFIWMAPYCPQWFGALGKTPARYLIYKDWNR